MISTIRDGHSPSFDKAHERLRVAKIYLWKSAYSAFMRIQGKKRYIYIKEEHILNKYFYQLFFIITFDSTIV